MTKAPASAQLICDITQSWSDVGGGVGTYLRRKREHILTFTPHRHLLIIPGSADSVTEDGRAITVTIASPPVPTSPNYRLLLRNRAVRAALERFRPDIVECQDSYNLPWAALRYRRDHPDVATVAGYFTDFPTAYVHRPLKRLIGWAAAGQLRSLAYRYCGLVYRRFDAVYALSESGGAAKLRELGVSQVGIVPLGVEMGEFDSVGEIAWGDDSLVTGRQYGVANRAFADQNQPGAQLVVDAFRKLPESLGARLVLIGEGPVRDAILATGHERIIAPGYLTDRIELARWLASADIYVSAMADETFGVSVVEAQASGLPVVGVAAGAMLDRVDGDTGRLGPVDDSKAMAANILDLCRADRQLMGEAARAHVEGQFSWDRTFQTLFGEVYPQAFAARRAAAQRSGIAAYARGTAA